MINGNIFSYYFTLEAGEPSLDLAKQHADCKYDRDILVSY